MKKTNIVLSLTLTTLFASLAVLAEVELTGKITHESARFTSDGTTIGADDAHGKDGFKTQTNARIYIDGEVSDNADFHLELNLMRDNKGVDDYFESNKAYTQRDVLREAYIDTEISEWTIRTGKQQVVWGTADGIKLLDLINPTDYSEMVQNTPEDSRIPLWMINAEKDLESGGSIQVVVSQPRENIFAGLNRDIDTSVRGNDLANAGPQGIPDIAGIGHNQGNAFILKGVDTITGAKNGFLNIAPDLGTIASGFGAGFLPLGTQNSFGGLSVNPVAGVTPGNSLVSLFTVGAFTSGANLADLSQGFINLQAGAGVPTNQQAGFDRTNFGLQVAGLACQNPQYTGGGSPGAAQCANLGGAGAQAAVTAIFNEVSGDYTGAQILDVYGAGYASNLSSFAANDGDNSAFEYMKLASFATFDTFVNARSQYIYDMPDDTDANIAFRFKNSLSNGLNYSLNYSYNYDTNPVIDLSWRNSAGEVLDKEIRQVSVPFTTLQGATNLMGQYVALTDAAGNAYGGAAATAAAGAVAQGGGSAAAQGAAIVSRSPILTFEQTLERAHNIGGSVDYAIDTKVLGAIVLRGEALYQKDVYSPIIDKSRLSFGDLTDALEMIPGDKFKYVLGVDITVLTNMLVSTQFIQERNLDYVDENGELASACRAGVNALNAPAAQGGSGLSLDANDLCVRYTGDFASMHLSNGLLKAEKNKNFISLFLSKPFGGSGEHRWNNITIFEDQGSGGFWNRLDVEYSLTDDMQLTGEWNRYWGEGNSQFGQLSKSSNAQVGFKYTF